MASTYTDPRASVSQTPQELGLVPGGGLEPGAEARPALQGGAGTARLGQAPRPGPGWALGRGAARTRHLVWGPRVLWGGGRGPLTFHTPDERPTPSRSQALAHRPPALSSHGLPLPSEPHPPPHSPHLRPGPAPQVRDATGAVEMSRRKAAVSPSLGAGLGQGQAGPWRPDLRTRGGRLPAQATPRSGTRQEASGHRKDPSHRMPRPLRAPKGLQWPLPRRAPPSPG